MIRAAPARCVFAPLHVVARGVVALGAALAVLVTSSACDGGGGGADGGGPDGGRVDGGACACAKAGVDGAGTNGDDGASDDDGPIGDSAGSCSCDDETVDAGADHDDTGDAGARADAGAPLDAGLRSDAGATAAVDGGGPADAGVTASTWRSSLYPVDWTPAFTDGTGRFLHDFSYAGYALGERAIPDVAGPFFDVVADATGALDAAPAIQAAIDAAAQAGGGVVRLSAGTFRAASPLVVRGDGVVLRGAGDAATFLSFSSPTPSGGAGLTFAGAPVEGPDVLLIDDAAARASSVRVADPASFAVGDDVDVGQIVTDAFVGDHGMTGTWQISNGQWRAFFRRTVLFVDGDRLVLDVPLRAPLLLRDGASVRRVTGLLAEVGLEDLAVGDAVDLASARANPRGHAIAFVAVKDAWLRRVRSFRPAAAETDHHLASGGVLVERSKRVTIDDVVLQRAQNRGDGGAGYLFEVMRASEVLMKDSVARKGRHNFVQNWDFMTSGCVFLRVVSEDGRAEGFLTTVALSEFHHSLATANLIDGAVANDGWGAVNRRTESSGAGHSATENVFWNVHGGVVRSMQWGWGYVIGTEGVDVQTSLDDIFQRAQGTTPEDMVEGKDEGDRLAPASLYEDQLARRLTSP